MGVYVGLINEHSLSLCLCCHKAKLGGFLCRVAAQGMRVGLCCATRARKLDYHLIFARGTNLQARKLELICCYCDVPHYWSLRQGLCEIISLFGDVGWTKDQINMENNVSLLGMEMGVGYQNFGPETIGGKYRFYAEIRSIGQTIGKSSQECHTGPDLLCIAVV